MSSPVDRQRCFLRRSIAQRSAGVGSALVALLLAIAAQAAPDGASSGAGGGVPTEPCASGAADSATSAADPASSAPAASLATPATEEAAQRYDRGLKLHAEGDYALAVIEFERAYELVPDFRALYNIGQVRLQLGQYARARRALVQYLQDGKDAVGEERRTAVEADLEMIASRTGTLRIEVSVPGAEVFVDDTLVGRSPFEEPLLMDAGEHRISARKSGYQSRSAQITLAGRDAISVRLEMEKVLTESQRIIVTQKQEESNRDAWLWGTWTATGVFAVASGVTGGFGIKAAGDLEDMRGEVGATRGELDSASRRARTLLLAADAFGALTILAGGAAVYVTLSDSEPEPKEKPVPGAERAREVSLAFKPSWVGLTGTY